MWAKRLKDKNIRKSYNSKEINNLTFLFLARNSSIDSTAKLLFNKRYANLNRKNFRTQVKNRCTISLRSRSPLRVFRISRILFRTLASSGFLLGIKKSSW